MAQLKRYNGTDWETVGGSLAPKTTKTNSDTDTYSCNYINQIGTIKQAFGDIFTSDGTYTATLYSHLVATYIGNDIWKIDFSGKTENNTGVSEYYDYGISISKIGSLLGLSLQNNTTSTLDYNSNWIYYGTDGKIDESLFGYGTIYEYKSSINALLPSRYYTNSGSVGGWSLNYFVNNSLLTGTIYLKEV